MTYIQVGEDWLVDMAYLDRDCLFVSDRSKGVSIHLERTEGGVEVRAYALPDVEPKHHITVTRGE